jgi:type II secretory pathway pseudopilin PulG
MGLSFLRIVILALSVAAVSGMDAIAQVDKSGSTTTASQPAHPKPKVTISKETTYITEPLRPDGYPDYIAYLDQRQRHGVTPENNAAVPLVRALGPREIAESVQAEFFKRLGIEPLPAKGDYFVDWLTYSKQFSAKDWPAVPARRGEGAREYFESLDSVASERPWTREDFPPLAEWLAENEKHIDQFVAASKRSRMYTPLITGEEEDATLVMVLLPVAQSSRQAARALVTRAMYRAGSGDMQAALEDLMACRRLARHTSQGFSLIESLVAIVMDHIALDAQVALLAGGKLTREHRDWLRQQVAKLPPRKSMADVLDQGERLMYLDSVCWISRTGMRKLSTLSALSAVGDGSPPTLPDIAMDLVIDWDVPLKVGNEWYDRFVKVARIEDPKKRVDVLRKIKDDLKKAQADVTDKSSLFGLLFSPRQVASQKMAQVFVSLLLPALDAALRAEHRNQAKHALLELGLALADYRADNRRFPLKLDELAPKYVKQAAIDPMWGEPFTYKQTDGGYLLYSVGQNGKDDGGRTADDDHGSDDLVIRVPANR